MANIPDDSRRYESQYYYGIVSESEFRYMQDMLSRRLHDTEERLAKAQKELDRQHRLWIPSHVMYTKDFLPRRVEPPSPKIEPEFEMNLTAPLLGWKRWKFSGDRIYSQQGPAIWIPDTPLKAQIDPLFHDNVGIHAVDKEDQISDGFGPILGEVFGWGKYIRGEMGWRAQFAYPKAFHLVTGQEHFVEFLKAYHVDIFYRKAETRVSALTGSVYAHPDDEFTEERIYSSEEDGYNGYREDYSTWDSGTSTDSGTEEG